MHHKIRDMKTCKNMHPRIDKEECSAKISGQSKKINITNSDKQNVL